MEMAKRIWRGHRQRAGARPSKACPPPFALDEVSTSAASPPCPGRRAGCRRCRGDPFRGRETFEVGAGVARRHCRIDQLQEALREGLGAGVGPQAATIFSSFESFEFRDASGEVEPRTRIPGSQRGPLPGDTRARSSSG